MKKLLIVILSTIFLSGCNRLDNHQPLTNSKIIIPEGSSISQTFIASRDNLNIVSICLRNPNRVNIPLSFSLLDNSQEVRHIDFSSGNIDGGDCTKFQFEPIENSANKQFVTTINTYPPEKDALIPLVITVEKNNDDLHYKTYYHQNLKEVINESISQVWPRIIADLGFFMFWVGATLYLLIRLFRSPSQ